MKKTRALRLLRSEDKEQVLYDYTVHYEHMSEQSLVDFADARPAVIVQNTTNAWRQKERARNAAHNRAGLHALREHFH